VRYKDIMSESKWSIKSFKEKLFIHLIKKIALLLIDYYAGEQSGYGNELDVFETC
jgi:hypothetical protein